MSLRRHATWELGAEWASRGRPRLLIVDNYDSFTYNLVQMLAVNKVALEVVRNDLLSAEQVLEQVEQGRVQGLVLSPGPGRPEDAGICADLLKAQPKIPILGVCLGHQAMGFASGAVVDRAPVLMHGKTSSIRFEDHAMFFDIPQPFIATRYHSLRVAEESLPDEWLPLAWSEEGILMAMAHRSLPYWGFQFHPESILTVDGAQLLANFVALTETYDREGQDPETRVQRTALSSEPASSETEL